MLSVICYLHGMEDLDLRPRPGAVLAGPPAGEAHKGAKRSMAHGGTGDRVQLRADSGLRDVACAQRTAQNA
jgi:hypothetical protein